MKRLTQVVHATIMCCLLVVAGGRAASAQNPDNLTDDQIRDALNRVLKRQIHPLADGEYPAVTSLAEAQAAKPPEGLRWYYPWGVDDYGMLAAGDVTGNPAAEQFVREHQRLCARYGNWLLDLQKTLPASKELDVFLKHTTIQGLITLGDLDSCGAMGNSLLAAQLRHPEAVTPADKHIDERIADWITNKQDRLPDGTLARSLATRGTVWPDDLFMACPFLVRWGQVTGERKFLDDAAAQLIHQAALEQDHDGLWYHGYSLTAKVHSPFKWGRGNGWAAVTAVEVLSALPENHPDRPALLGILRRQIEGLKPLQTSSGMWRQVLDQADLWEETSCTAMFAYSIARAVNRGWIDPANMTVARRAFAGVCQQIDAEGSVQNTCEGTGICYDLAAYARRKRPPNDPHGPGPVLLAGAEILAANTKSRSLTVDAVNKLPLARSSQTIELSAGSLAGFAEPNLEKIHVKDAQGREMLCQAVDADGDELHRPDLVIFQADFAPSETKTFTVSAGAKQHFKKEEFKAYGRFVRERFDDFAWENDRVAHRIYGQALETWKGEPLTSSAVDIWSKRTPRLVLNDWYMLRDPYTDRGDGLDAYSAGTSRGCGGTGLWAADRLWSSRNFVASRVLAAGPIRVVFELDYAPFNVDGAQVAESKRVSLDAGSQLSAYRCSYKVTGGGGDALRPAIGLKKVKGEQKSFDAAHGTLTTWEPMEQHAGQQGLAVVVDPGVSLLGEAEDAQNDLLFVKPGTDDTVSFHAGFAWDRAGLIADAGTWRRYVDEYAQGLASPIEVRVRAVP